MKKIIITMFAATSLLLYSTPSFALFSVSVGIPMSQTITGNEAGKSYGPVSYTHLTLPTKRIV